MDIPAILARLKRVARELGLPFGERSMTYNSRLAQELGKWADDQGYGDRFHHDVFLAYFRDGENIGQASVLLRICRDVGLDPVAAEQALAQRTYAPAVDRDWARSHQLGIRAVPTFVINDQRLVGAQSYTALERMALSESVARRAR